MRLKLALVPWLLGCTLWLGACTEKPVQEAEFYVFGTLVDVSLSDADPELANQAFAHLQQRFQAMHRDWHAWEPGKLTEINQQFSQGQTARADPELVQLVELSQQAEKLTGGRFNAAIGGLIGLWGFHTSTYPIIGPPPSEVDIAELVALHPSTLDIEIRGDDLFSANPAVQLDFGGIAKGFAVDLACEELSALGVRNAIVNAGGDLRAFGMRGSAPWRVAIRNPLGGVLGGVEIRQDEAVFTSGNYERFRETAAQERYAHILDPATGWPATGLMSATVIARQGWKADAAATALIVAGLNAWSDVASAMNLDQVLLVDERGRVHATVAMQARLILTDPAKPVLTLSPN